VFVAVGAAKVCERVQYVTTDPVVVVVAMSVDGTPVLYVNSKKTPWDELGNTWPTLKRKATCGGLTW
jgi:hypothetical protein